MSWQKTLTTTSTPTLKLVEGFRNFPVIKEMVSFIPIPSQNQRALNRTQTRAGEVRGHFQLPCLHQRLYMECPVS